VTTDLLQSECRYRQLCSALCNCCICGDSLFLWWTAV